MLYTFVVDFKINALIFCDSMHFMKAYSIVKVVEGWSCGLDPSRVIYHMILMLGSVVWLVVFISQIYLFGALFFFLGLDCTRLPCL